MVPASENQTSTSSVNVADPKLDSLVLSLLQAYCEKIPALPIELRYLEIGGPHAADAWRTQCVFARLTAKGMLFSPSREQLVHLQEHRPQDIVIYGRLSDCEDKLPEARTESNAPEAPENDETVGAPRWSLDDLIEREFSFNRLDYLVVHGEPETLWCIQTCEFRAVRPYMLHLVSHHPLDRQQTHDAITLLGRRDFVLVASQSRDLIFLDALAFLRPEQSSSFIV